MKLFIIIFLLLFIIIIPFANEMILINGGKYTFGNYFNSNLLTKLYNIILSDFYMSKYEISQKEWSEIMNCNPSLIINDDFPVTNVNWFDAIEYCNKLSIKEGLEPCYKTINNNVECNFYANGYRLPTEAEWEYAAMCGSKKLQKYLDNFKNEINNIKSNSLNKIGTTKPNTFGIYDMFFNASEWCWDWCDDLDGYMKGLNPKGPQFGKYRVLRGGSNKDTFIKWIVYIRNKFDPKDKIGNIGFRIVRSNFKK